MNLLHRGFAAVDGMLVGWLPEAALIVFWGCVAGAAAMLLYRWTSDQRRIRDSKDHLAQLRARMLSPELTHREVMQLSMQNLKGSFGLLGRVIGPSLLSVIPVLLIASWLHAEYCCRAPAPGAEVAIHHEPLEASVRTDPSAASSAPGVNIVRYRPSQPLVRIESGEVQAFLLDLRSPPTLSVSPPSWWSALLSDAGSLDPRAAIDKLYVDLQRKEFLAIGPQWMRGWEFPYFLAIFVVALALKIGLRIH